MEEAGGCDRVPRAGSSGGMRDRRSAHAPAQAEWGYENQAL